MSLKSSAPIFILVAIIFLNATVHTSAARDSWVSVKSNELNVIGNSSEKDVREIAERLLQFRQIVPRIFPALRADSRVPTTVIVFKDNSSYSPFKVSDNNAGFCQPGRDMNYITLSHETRGEQDQVNIVFHEYTHLLVNKSLGETPAWFNEGLAELYSTLNIKGDTRVLIGQPIRRHVATLRDQALIPLRVLLNIDYKSPYYTEIEKQSLFYAESWAFLHYLMLSNNGQRADQVVRFVQLLSKHTPIDEAFKTAFSTSVEAMETDLQGYIQQERYRFTERAFSATAQTDVRLESSGVSEAALQAYFGDLLFHSNRPEAEDYLQKALLLNPDQPLARESLGALRYKQGRIAEALPFLEQAFDSDSTNVLALYYYASALCMPISENPILNFGYAPELAAKSRAALKKAIALRPDFSDSYNLLAYINLVTTTDIDQTVALMQEVSARSPDRIDFIYMLGQLYMHRDEYKRARPLLEKVVAADVENDIRQHAKTLLATMRSIEEEQARKEAARRARSASSSDSESTSGSAFNRSPNDAWLDLRNALRVPGPEEKQLQGLLLSIDCDAGGLVFVIKTGDRMLRLKTPSFEQIRRTTFTAEVQGTLTCGTRKPENAVVVCFRPMLDRRMKLDGMLSSVEFVPSDFTLVPTSP